MVFATFFFAHPGCMILSKRNLASTWAAVASYEVCFPCDYYWFVKPNEIVGQQTRWFLSR